MNDTNRRTGRTTRMLLGALIAASEKPDQRVAVYARTVAMARWIFTRLVELARPIGGVAVSASERAVTLANGSRIMVRAVERDEEAMRGASGPTFYDHA